MTTTIELAAQLEAATINFFENNVPCSKRIYPSEFVCKEAAQRLRELDKPDCIYTLCPDDSPTPQTLESTCGGAMWYLGDDGNGAYPKFCHNCGGTVKHE